MCDIKEFCRSSNAPVQPKIVVDSGVLNISLYCVDVDELKNVVKLYEFIHFQLNTLSTSPTVHLQATTELVFMTISNSVSRISTK